MIKPGKNHTFSEFICIICKNAYFVGVSPADKFRNIVFIQPKHPSFLSLRFPQIVVYRSIALVREHPSLPLWGRWHGEAVTEEVLPQYEFAESYRKNETLYRTSPAPYGGTPPKGEGFGCINTIFLNLSAGETLTKYAFLHIIQINLEKVRFFPGFIIDNCGKSFYTILDNQ